MTHRIHPALLAAALVVVMPAGNPLEWSAPGKPALAQPYGPGPGGRMGPGMGPGMGMGRGAMAFGNIDDYLASLKTRLAILPAQEAAWAGYAATLKEAATQLQGVHQTMWDAMDTADWQERQGMMNRALESRQAVFDSVRTAAQKLAPALTPTQRDQAAWMLPGLRARGPGMGMGAGMGRYR